MSPIMTTTVKVARPTKRNISQNRTDITLDSSQLQPLPRTSSDTVCPLHGPKTKRQQQQQQQQRQCPVHPEKKLATTIGSSGSSSISQELRRARCPVHGSCQSNR
ncbi:hypothetical protein TKK_0009684 [Trichogramma kaykai]